METLFMRVFERRDEAEAQMRQQAASYSRALACGLLTAGHQPPPWLLPHPAPFAALFRRGAVEEHMQLQVEAYSKSIACALIDAGHLPPPWLLPHSATGRGTFERSVPADARMRKQVVSYSLSISCALLAAGHRPPPWLLQSPADVATTEGNTIRKASVYLTDPQSADHVQHELSEINHQVKQNTLEAPRFQTFEASNSMASPPLENGSSHSTKSNFLEGLDCVSCPLPENGAIDIVDNVSIEVSQGWPQTDVSEETYYMPIVLPDKEGGHSSETPADVATQGNTVTKASVYLADPQSADQVQHESSEINHQVKQNPLEALRFQTFETSNSMASPPLENGSSHSTKSNFLEGLDCVSCPLPENVLSAPINESALHLADTTEAHDVCVWNNIDIDVRPEALSAASSKRASISHTLERNSVMSLDKSVPVQECQSFSVPVPSDSPTITKRALQGFCESKKPVNFCSSLSVRGHLKKVRALSITNAGKIIHSLRDRLSKTETSCSKSERNIRETNLKKGCRPWNTGSNLTSFIPLAKQNQQPPKSCEVIHSAKRDARVRALKVAAAAKRREEKKQTEREMHKAAVKLALERKKQEKEHRQKQDRKRENDRKKKCAEEAPKHQKRLEEIMHSTNTMKDVCPNDTGGKGLVENLVERVGNQLSSDERTESVQRLLAYESNSVKAMYADWKSAGSWLQVQENLSDNVDKSYGMTPYEDSDAKGFKILEHQREIRRRHKLIPSWAQEENLDKILVSNLALDSREVFAHKCSAILSDVLTRGNRHQPIY